MLKKRFCSINWLLGKTPSVIEVRVVGVDVENNNTKAISRPV
jgi:hypothetical protein